MNKPTDPNPAPEPVSADEFAARRRGRNFALGGSILALVILFYLVTLARMG